MPDQTFFNFDEAIHGVDETRIALERAGACVSRLEQLLTERPQSFAPLAQAAFRLRDRLIEDLETLEAGLAHASSSPSPGPKQPDFNLLDPPQRDPDAPFGDAVPLGGQ
jgi:hypothetical protein